MLVGRSGELARLDALVVSTQMGAGGCLVLVGDPGIGKSAMLDALHRRARRRGLRVLRATAGRSTCPGSLLADLQASTADGSDRRTDLGWPQVDEALALLDALVGPGPVLLLVDDAHAADALSLTTLRTAIERVGPARLAAVVAGPADGVLAQHLPRWPRLRLDPLDREAARTVLRASLGPGNVVAVPDQVIDALHGNPQALVAAHDLLSPDQLSGRAALPTPMPVPPALVTGWARTLDRLGQPAQDALLDLAISGGRLDLLTAMAGSGRALAERPVMDGEDGVPSPQERRDHRGMHALAARPPAPAHHRPPRRSGAVAEGPRRRGLSRDAGRTRSLGSG